MFVPYCSNNVLPSHQCFTRHKCAIRHQENGNDCDQTQKRLLHNEQHCFNASQMPFMPSRCYHSLLSARLAIALASIPRGHGLTVWDDASTSGHTACVACSTFLRDSFHAAITTASTTLREDMHSIQMYTPLQATLQEQL